MTAKFFVDTNVLVYSRDASEPTKQPRAEAWRRALWRARAGRISAQVLNEYYQVLTRKLAPGFPRTQAQADVRNLARWQPVALTSSLLEAAWTIEERYRLSLWDALIVAAAQAAGCDYLLSEDLQHGQDLDGVEVIDPFQVAPDDLIRSQNG